MENVPRKTLQQILMTPFEAEHRTWVQESTDEELEKYISASGGSGWRFQLGLGEQNKRRFNQLKKPHWTTTPTFWVATAAMVFAAISIWPVIRDWIQSSPPANINSSSQQPQSNSRPSISTIMQTTTPAIYVELGTNLDKTNLLMKNP